MNTINPPTDFGFASPQIGVEIYPQSGDGPILFTGGQTGILEASITKDIRDRNGGTFTLIIPPGGPSGVDDPLSWTNIISMNSLAVIYLMRGDSRRIVMVGLITSVKEIQRWTNRRVERLIEISGSDFTYFFSAFSFYEMTYLGFFQNQPAQQPLGPAGWIIGQFGKQLTGSPPEEVFLWLNYVMLGVGNPKVIAVLDNTYLFYKNQQVFLRNLIGHWIESFTEDGEAVFIPFLTDVVNSEGTWMDKFLSILPWPWYEFFITTAKTTDYSALTAPPAGDFVSIPPTTETATGFDLVFPTVIGRVNPLPWIEYPIRSPLAGGAKLHKERWDQLNLFSLGSFSFLNSTVGYNLTEVSNFFGIQTVDSSTVADAQSGSNQNMFAFELLGGILDHSSINTYGFRSNFVNTRWLTSLAPTVPGDKKQFSIDKLSKTLLGKLASYYIPTPWMLNGEVSLSMWPDILPGNRFVYQPFKNNVSYMFYIEAVTHKYTFGGDCVTSLAIDRGLQVAEYNDPQTLTSLHQDLLVRKNGVLTQRSTTATNAGAFFIKPSDVASIGIMLGPYFSAPPKITP